MKRVFIAFIITSLLFCCVVTVSAAGESSGDEMTVFGTPAPSNHMDMVNGFGSEYLDFAKAGIFENYSEALKFGISLFAVILGVFVVSRLIKTFIGVGMEVRYGGSSNVDRVASNASDREKPVRSRRSEPDFLDVKWLQR